MVLVAYSRVWQAPPLMLPPSTNSPSSKCTRATMAIQVQHRRATHKKTATVRETLQPRSYDSYASTARLWTPLYSLKSVAVGSLIVHWLDAFTSKVMPHRGVCRGLFQGSRNDGLQHADGRGRRGRTTSVTSSSLNTKFCSLRDPCAFAYIVLPGREAAGRL